MFSLKRNLIVLALTLTALIPAVACNTGAGDVSKNTPPSISLYSWVKVTDAAAFPGAYNFHVFTVRRQMWAFHHQGNWYSTDGRVWTKSELPVFGLNAGTQKYVQFNDAIYALGTTEGNWTEMRLGSRIARTSDFKRWEVLAEK